MEIFTYAWAILFGVGAVLLCLVKMNNKITNIAWIKKIVIGFCTISVVLAVLQAFIWHI